MKVTREEEQDHDWTNADVGQDDWWGWVNPEPTADFHLDGDDDSEEEWP